jgi:transaldolase/glucose-6-phosphate isomerase
VNPLVALEARGQSIWLDYIHRTMTRSGELGRMVTEQGLRGMTSNPAIFQQAIAGSEDYADALRALMQDPSRDTKAIYEALAIEDIREAADVLRPVFDESDGTDGHVSFEVSPSLALDAEGTLEEARRLWRAVDRPNLMIKVPGTDAGLVAIEQLLYEGINVNVTLIFSTQAYAKILETHVRGLERRVAAGLPIRGIAGVASFFISRIDSEVDARLDRLAKSATGAEKARIEGLRGKAAIANARVTYADVYRAMIGSARWQTLVDAGAQPQRMLWASTGTKNKAYSDVLYIEELIGPDTVNTAPPATIEAFLDHGKIADRLLDDLDEARQTMAALAEVGVDFADVTDLLLERGLELFRDAMDGLLSTVAQKQRSARGPRLSTMELALPEALAEKVAKASAAWDAADSTARLWRKDASLWTGADEAKWLGWLDIVEANRARAAELTAFAAEAATPRLSHVLLLGMGGSSLGPDVLARTFARRVPKGSPKLQILDSTVPDQVARVGKSIDPATTLFVVASKSGSTLEPKVFRDHFLAKAKAALGDAAGKHFVAITDPGSKLEAEAKADGFARIFYGKPEIGGRYSALSDFGLVPAALMGLSVDAVLGEAQVMVEACRNTARAVDNPGVSLGIVLGQAALAGRDKLTLFASPPIASFGAWVEQLVAESTGKHGKAIIPVDGEPVAAPGTYGDDRLFVYLRLRSTPDGAQDRAVAALVAAGHPVVRIDLDDVDALPQEFFRWEIATATAGSVMALHPFDQPDVEASKLETRAMTSAFEETGALPSETPQVVSGQLSLYCDAEVAGRLASDDLVAWLRRHLAHLSEGDYFACLAYVDMNDRNAKTLTAIRNAVGHNGRFATCLGFGPRFLHSTGQAYKGGPGSGVFLQVTHEPTADIALPGSKLTFGTIAAAQARGDFAVLVQRKRRAVRIHITGDVATGLDELHGAVLRAIA